MSTETCLHTPEEISRRYRHWTRIPRNDEEARAAAWFLYCDARDNLPDGTTEAADAAQVDDRQLPLFGERRFV